jgi:hypothetical protein
VLNNPLRYTDPSGNRECDDQWGCEGPPPGRSIVPPPEEHDDGGSLIPPPDVPSDSSDPVDAFSDMVWGEGGGLHAQIAVNILQVLHNTEYTAWVCSGTRSCLYPRWNSLFNLGNRPWDTISPQEFMGLGMFLAGMDYIPGDVDIPAYNAWGHPHDPVIDANPVLSERYLEIHTAVLRWTENGPGALPEEAPIWIEHSGYMYYPAQQLRSADVMFYYSSGTEIPFLEANAVYIDRYAGRIQYYLTFPYP